MIERLAEGMCDLEAILEKRDTVLCAPMLLIYAHKRCKTVGKSYNGALSNQSYYIRLQEHGSDWISFIFVFVSDREAVEKLDAKVRSERTTCGETVS